MTIEETLRNYIRAAYPAIAINTTDERMALLYVRNAATVAPTKTKTVYVWSVTAGLVKLGNAAARIPAQTFPDTQDLTGVCMWFAQQRKQLRGQEENAVIVLRDVDTWQFDRDPALTRSLRDLISESPESGSTVVVLATNWKPHPSIEPQVTVINHALPSEADMADIAAAYAKDLGLPAPGPDVARALCGMTPMAAQNALALSFVTTNGFDLATIYREKIQAVNRAGVMTVVDPDPRGMDAIGGLENLKSWISRRKRCWSPEAKARKVSEPKGVLLCGPPGTGKSIAAKAIGTALGIPTLRLDCGSLFNSLVGESERITREVTQLAEAMAPCVVWIDEIEKGMAGAGGSGSSDGGVTRRVFGTLLSWMQERKRPVFVVATTNDVLGLPPEFTRKGRFDEIFSVDLPNAEARAEVFRIHMGAKDIEVKAMDLDALVNATHEYTPAEIEAIVEEGVTDAFDLDQAPTTTHFLAVAGRINPMARTMADQLRAAREWSKASARQASAGDPIPVSEGIVPQRRIVGAMLLTEESTPAAPPERDPSKVS